MDELTKDVLALYRQESVPQACLFLQQHARIDVNLLLMAAWVGARRRRLVDSESLQRAGALVADWHREIVQPLRAVRRRLKIGPPPAPDEKTRDLRAALQALEISAEMIELAELAKVADNLGRPALAGEQSEAAANNMWLVVAMFAGRPADTDEKKAVNMIATNAMDLFS